MKGKTPFCIILKDVNWYRKYPCQLKECKYIISVLMAEWGGQTKRPGQRKEPPSLAKLGPKLS